MITRIKKRMNAGGEGGFTLIELLVVIIIIAILAAIAIPMYLSQRQKGWKANVQSDLRNAAVAEESYYTAHSQYTAALADLTTEGYNNSASIHMSAPVPGTVGPGAGSINTSYCLEAYHTSDQGATTMHFDSGTGDPVAGGC